MANNQDLFNKTYQSLLATYTKDVPEVQYNPQSESSLRAKLENALRPAYDKQIAARQQQTAKNRAAVDADAAARGMGSSTWVTDSKNRLNNAEATDVSNLNSDYISNLSSQLLQQLLSQEANKINVDEFNASNKGAAQQLAWSTALANYDKFNKSSGGGKKQTGDDTDKYVDALNKEMQATNTIKKPKPLGMVAGKVKNGRF